MAATTNVHPPASARQPPRGFTAGLDLLAPGSWLAFNIGDLVSSGAIEVWANRTYRHRLSAVARKA